MPVTVAATCVAVSACGGESRRHVYTVPSSETSDPEPGEVPAPSPPTSGTATPIPTGSATAAPPLGTGRVLPPADCPAELEVDVDPRNPVATFDGIVTVVPLQEPGAWNTDPPPVADRDPDPSTWDRSSTPAGACVFHLYGVDGRCYPEGGTFFTGPCVALDGPGPKVAPGSYYENPGICSGAPGCPSTSADIGAPGYWWYLGDPFLIGEQIVTDLVICAPECFQSFTPNGGCLRLRPNVSASCQ